MKAIWSVLLLFPSMLAADGWTRAIEDTTIITALAGRTVSYDAYTLQRFGTDGATQYITERMSEGSWAARGGQYCSVWPPSDVWTCYILEVQGARVRFIASDGSVSEGRYVD